MSPQTTHYDALHRWAQAGGGKHARLVRLTAGAGGNRYAARPVAFAETGGTETVGETTLTVTNLAEPADAAGGVPAGTDALAISVEGRWVVFIRAASAAAFPARVVAAIGGAAYTVREQAATGAGTFADAPGTIDLAAFNLAELSLGAGSAVDAGTIVLVLATTDTGAPPTVRYVFDHPAYAKYLD